MFLIANVYVGGKYSWKYSSDVALADKIRWKAMDFNNEQDEGLDDVFRDKIIEGKDIQAMLRSKLVAHEFRGEVVEQELFKVQFRGEDSEDKYLCEFIEAAFRDEVIRGEFRDEVIRGEFRSEVIKVALRSEIIKAEFRGML